MLSRNLVIFTLFLMVFSTSCSKPNQEIRETESKTVKGTSQIDNVISFYEYLSREGFGKGNYEVKIESLKALKPTFECLDNSPIFSDLFIDLMLQEIMNSMELFEDRVTEFNYDSSLEYN